MSVTYHRRQANGKPRLPFSLSPFPFPSADPFVVDSDGATLHDSTVTSWQASPNAVRLVLDDRLIGPKRIRQDLP